MTTAGGTSRVCAAAAGTAELTFLQVDDRIIAQRRDCFRPMQYGQANLFVVLTEQACASRLAASPVTEALTLKATQALR
jgi:hypothetical protein